MISMTQKRSWTFVTVLQRLSVAETTKDRSLRDFRSLSIFDFFNSIWQRETFHAHLEHYSRQLTCGAYVPRAVLLVHSSATA